MTQLIFNILQNSFNFFTYKYLQIFVIIYIMLFVICLIWKNKTMLGYLKNFVKCKIVTYGVIIHLIISSFLSTLLNLFMERLWRRKVIKSKNMMLTLRYGTFRRIPSLIIALQIIKLPQNVNKKQNHT